jgi:hypothetical protein
MSEQDVRLECLRLACESGDMETSTLGTAQMFYAWVISGVETKDLGDTYAGQCH